MKLKIGRNSGNGFTMVELLAVVVILGILSLIGIASVSSLIQKSKDDQKQEQGKMIVMAAESYLQANSDALPKVIGGEKKIKLSDLKNSNYIQKDVKNANGESCMSNSYVSVYKRAKNKYTYSVYFYCGENTTPDIVTVP